jgi:hypothetical protein
MFVMRTIKDPTIPLGEIVSSQQIVGFDDLALAVDPLGLNGLCGASWTATANRSRPKGAKGKISGENLPRPSDTDVRETRRNFRRVSSLRVCDPDGSATNRGPSDGIGPYD